ncbi:MAG: M42 family metallopeptidase [Clostridia bacterium]|nr:M42 family metallopeptidase [Clostridia bacterium]
MTSGVALIKKLATAFGPSGCEGAVEALIREELQGTSAVLSTDKMGNLTARLAGPEGAPRIMLSAHMDEVGFMVTEIEESGLVRFACVGGIDPRVMCGRFVKMGNEEKQVPGVLTAKGIHFMDRDERKKMPSADQMYIDVGTTSREETEKLLSLGDFGTFDTEFMQFGENGAYVASKALDDRMGCAILIEVLRTLSDKHLPLDLYFCFTVREEIGLSGAGVTANRIAPHAAIILETTAIADIEDVPPARRVADVGRGGVLSLADRSTIYDRDFVQFALKTGAEHGIPVQVKRYVSGGNDAGHIQRTGAGVRCIALSAATRYLHAPISVAALSDVKAMENIIIAMLTNWNEGGI